MADTTKGVVLVTGISGYLGGWVVKKLLEAGWKVRGTVRNVKDTDKYKHLEHQNLEVVAADLMKPETWSDAVKGCTYVIHVASPFPLKLPKDEQQVIKPAVDGAVNVLKAASEEKSVKRVVLTSSEVAVREGWEKTEKKIAQKIFTEDDWSVVEHSNSYGKSKHLAEKAAWKFMEELPKERNLELVVINPGFIIGPILTASGGGDGSSRVPVTRLMTNDVPGIPATWLNFVDVRDVADAHIAALTNPDAPGNRFICSSEGHWFVDMAKVLHNEFSKYGYKVPVFQVPTPLIWVVSLWDEDAGFLLPTLGAQFNLDNSKIQKVLGIKFRSYSSSLIDMANSFIEFGVIPDLVKSSSEKKTKN